MRATLVVRDDASLFETLRRLAREEWMVFFAGLPGTGKSLLAHQLAHLAHEAGRTVHFLQWDDARPVFEASPAGRRYPLADGVTHVVIRKAAGLWVRAAIAGWVVRHPGPEHLLIGEVPLIGHRFIELARRQDDPAEPFLSAASCRFALPVPSCEVRRFLEAERERRSARPLHPREHEDAPPHVLRDLWLRLVEVARHLDLVAPAERAAGDVAYDPVVYRRVYAHLLRRRQVDVLPVERVLHTTTLSVYDFTVPRREIRPTPDEVARFIADVEARYPDLVVLEREVERWYVV